jgi:hypothetical protein
MTGLFQIPWIFVHQQILVCRVSLLDFSNEPSRVVIEAKLKKRRLHLVIAFFTLSPFLVAAIAVLYVNATDDI